MSCVVQRLVVKAFSVLHFVWTYLCFANIFVRPDMLRALLCSAVSAMYNMMLAKLFSQSVCVQGYVRQGAFVCCLVLRGAYC